MDEANKEAVKTGGTSCVKVPKAAPKTKRSGVGAAAGALHLARDTATIAAFSRRY